MDFGRRGNVQVKTRKSVNHTVRLHYYTKRPTLGEQHCVEERKSRRKDKRGKKTKKESCTRMEVSLSRQNQNLGTRRIRHAGGEMALNDGARRTGFINALRRNTLHTVRLRVIGAGKKEKSHHGRWS